MFEMKDIVLILTIVKLVFEIIDYIKNNRP